MAVYKKCKEDKKGANHLHIYSDKAFISKYAAFTIGGGNEDLLADLSKETYVSQF